MTLITFKGTEITPWFSQLLRVEPVFTENTAPCHTQEGQKEGQPRLQFRGGKKKALYGQLAGVHIVTNSFNTFMIAQKAHPCSPHQICPHGSSMLSAKG